MPFWLHSSDSEPTDGTVYHSKQDALAVRIDGQTVTFVCSDEDRQTWKNREYERFRDGVYTHVPWSETWTQPAAYSHFAHVSVKFPGLIAYTPSDEFGAQDRQLRVKPGKYLTEFFPDMTQADLDVYVGRVKAHDGQFQTATSAEDIVSVYRNGPNSCMSHSHTSYRSGEHHPVSVYGGSDLAVAYLGNIATDVSARCVIWPAKKIYTRVYGDCQLGQLLKQSGYESGTLDGAKIRAIEVSRGSDRWVMPYVDEAESADLDRDQQWFTLSDDSGDYSVKETDGVSCAGSKNTCAECGSECDEDETWCSSCNDDRFCCEHCNEDFFGDSNGRSCEQGWYCDDCISNASHECAVCEESICSYDFSRSDRNNRDMSICTDCEETHTQCGDCSEWTANDDLTDDLCCDCQPEPEPYRALPRPKGTVLRRHSVDGPVDPIHVADMVTIRDNNGTEQRITPAKIVADLFAINPSINDADLWAVTHIPTGLAGITRVPSYALALRIAEKYAGLDASLWAFTDRTNVPTGLARQACDIHRECGL